MEATSRTSTHAHRLGRFAAATLAVAVSAVAAVGAPSADAAPVKGEYIVQFQGAQGGAAGRALVEHAGGRITRDLHVIDAVGARLTAGQADELAHAPGVKAVTENATVTPTAAGIDPKKLETAYNASAKTQDLWGGATGKGVGVAVIDTGVAGDLPDFRRSQTDASSRVIASAVVNPNATTAGDSYGHGTMVAGILGGNAANRDKTDPLRQDYAGSAPEADIVSVKISDEQGVATVLDAIYGVQFAVDHAADYGIRVINLSFSSSAPQSYTTDPLDAAVESAWMHGIVVVAAAGNDGPNDAAVSAAPGNDPYVITVGSVDDGATKDTKDDVITSWSSRGRTQDGLVKPDVYAPGAHIVSNLAPGSAFTSMCPDCVVDGQYIQAGGTSLSAPIVAGAVAGLLQKHPSWTPDMVKGAILNTARDVPGGAGREMDAMAANGAAKDKLVANVGLTPNTLIGSAATGAIDYTRATWRAADWTSMPQDVTASWTRATWRCTCSTADGATVDPTRATWRRATWRTDWSR
jgi:serine protease AprX